ncbi:MAG: hypothetical protein C4519_00335 [Desulfobacteraceae bacterium]|nr:MAG: hypothetical protein C4519_00335 [Desulfobacteraceae bacterium]
MSQVYQIRTDRNLTPVGTHQQKRTAFRPRTGGTGQVGHIYYMDPDVDYDMPGYPQRLLYRCVDGLNFAYLGNWTPALAEEVIDKPQSISLIFSKDGTELFAVTTTQEWVPPNTYYYRLYYGKYNVAAGTWANTLIATSSSEGFNYPDIELDGRGMPMVVVKRTDYSELYYYDANLVLRSVRIGGSNPAAVIKPTILVAGHDVYVHAETNTQGYLYRFPLNPQGVPMPPQATEWVPVAETNLTDAQMVLSPNAIGILGLYSNATVQWVGFRKWEQEALTDPEMVVDFAYTNAASYGLTYRLDRFHAIYTTAVMNEPRYVVRNPDTELWDAGVQQPPFDSECWAEVSTTRTWPNPQAMDEGTFGFAAVQQRAAPGPPTNKVKYMVIDNWWDPVITPGTYWPHGGLADGRGSKLGFDINNGAAHVLTGALNLMDALEIGEDLLFTDNTTILYFTGSFTEHYAPGRDGITTMLWASGSVDAGIPQWKLCEWAVVDFDIVQGASLSVTIGNDTGTNKKFTLTREQALKPFRVNLQGRHFTVRVEERSCYDATIRSVELKGQYFGGCQ